MNNRCGPWIARGPNDTGRANGRFTSAPTFARPVARPETHGIPGASSARVARPPEALYYCTYWLATYPER